MAPPPPPLSTIAESISLWYVMGGDGVMMGGERWWWAVRDCAAYSIRYARSSFENFGCERGLGLSTRWQWSVMVTGERSRNRAEHTTNRATSSSVRRDASLGPSPGIAPRVLRMYSHVLHVLAIHRMDSYTRDLRVLASSRPRVLLSSSGEAPRDHFMPSRRV